MKHSLMSENEIELLISSKCPLCAEIGNCSDSLSNILGTNIGHIIMKNAHFSLLRDINPIIPGHSILVTNAHYTSFGQIPIAHSREFIEIKNATDSLFHDRYGSYFLFEHGTTIHGAECRNCVSHAHIHYIPHSIKIEKYLHPYSVILSNESNTEILQRLRSIKCEYFYYEDNYKNSVLVQNPIYPVPRQFLRMIMANELSLEDWNWRSILSGYTKRGNNVNH
jgi:diadenosine tetraphosphate (Ap4A) HIT family hydrolase